MLNSSFVHSVVGDAAGFSVARSRRCAGERTFQQALAWLEEPLSAWLEETLSAQQLWVYSWVAEGNIGRHSGRYVGLGPTQI